MKCYIMFHKRGSTYSPFTDYPLYFMHNLDYESQI